GNLSAIMSVGLRFDQPENIGFASGPFKLISRKDQCLAVYRRVSAGVSSIVVGMPVFPVGWNEIIVYTSNEVLSDPDIAESDTAGVGVAFTIRGATGSTVAFVSTAGVFLPRETVAAANDPAGASIAATPAGFEVAWQQRGDAGETITQAAFRPPGVGGT